MLIELIFAVGGPWGGGTHVKEGFTFAFYLLVWSKGPKTRMYLYTSCMK